MLPPRIGLGLLFALLVGCAGGFEHKADVRAPKPIVRERFHLEYPGNWTIDEADEDYDPDHLFSIDSPGACHVTVLLFEMAISAKASVEAQVEAFVAKLVKDPVQTPFTKWGAYQGEGVLLTGRFGGLLPGSIRIFAHESESEDLTLTIVEFCYDEDLPLVRPGFELIERTFELGAPE